MAIDPGTTMSAYVVMNEDYVPLMYGKKPNAEVLDMVKTALIDELVIECMEARHIEQGVIGDETYETCIWIGRFIQAAYQRIIAVHRVYRREERSCLIPSKRNKLPALPEWAGKSADAQIRAALIQRFAVFDKKNGKGTRENPDVFYGFAADVWQAYAVGVVHIDRSKGGDADRNRGADDKRQSGTDGRARSGR